MSDRYTAIVRKGNTSIQKDIVYKQIFPDDKWRTLLRLYKKKGNNLYNKDSIHYKFTNDEYLISKNNLFHIVNSKGIIKCVESCKFNKCFEE